MIQSSVGNNIFKLEVTRLIWSMLAVTIGQQDYINETRKVEGGGIYPDIESDIENYFVIIIFYYHKIARGTWYRV